MAMLFDDEISGIRQPAPTSSLFAAPSSGLGMAPQAYTSRGTEDEILSGMGTMGKLGLALQSFGAGVQGRPDPMDAMIKRRREEKLLQLQTYKLHNEALEDSVKMTKGLRGDARTKFIEQQAQNLDRLNPQLGTAFRALAEKPDMMETIKKYGEDIPQLKMAFELGGEEAVYKLVQSPEFSKMIEKHIDVKATPIVMQKIRSMVMGLQQLAPPEMAQRFNKDGVLTASELLELNEHLKTQGGQFAKLALDDDQLSVLHRNGKTILDPLGVLSGDKEQEVMAARAKDASKAPTTRTRYVGTTEIQEEWDSVTKLWKEFGKGPRFKPESADKAFEKNRDTELKLADDYARDAKGFKDVAAKFSAATKYYADVAATGKQPTPAGDRALVFTYAKMLDPGDKVAVKDVQDIDKLAGVPQRIAQGVKNLVSGKLLPDDVRKELYSVIRQEFTQHNRTQRQIESEYEERTRRYRLDPRNVVIPYSMKIE